MALYIWMRYELPGF